ncbi:MAG: S8 family serine peptidase, partial [Planctomycetota bacterium]
VEIARQSQAELADAIAELAGRADASHIVVQFDRPIGTAERTQLRAAGMNLLTYLGNQAFFASLADGGVNVSDLSALPFLASVQSIERAWKLDPRIIAGDVPTWAVVAEDISGGQTVGVYVLFHGDVPLHTRATATAERHGARVRDVLESVNGVVIELPLSNIGALADEDAVQWIEWPLPRMSEINDSNRAITEADIVQGAPYNLDGSGVTVLVYDAGTGRASHVDFQGRLTVRDSSGMANHATHVSGTVGGAGVASPTHRGMAPGVSIESYGFEYDGTGTFLYSNPGDIEADYDQAINVYGADISNNSIGTNTETNGFDCTIQGNYGVTSALIDSIVGGSLGGPFRIVWANGNERQGSRCDIEGYGDYYSTAPPAGAKNHIAVGALNSNDDSMTSFSSWGPVDDGRMKPDVSAPGCQSGGDGGVTSCSSSGDTAYTTMCGTSMASPTTCGLSALLLQDFRNQFSGEPDFRNSTLKILLAHNAEDRGNVGPDHQFGYGSVRIQRTVDFMRSGNFLENQVDQGQTFSVLVLVNAGDPELKVTLAWDDVPGTPNVDPALVNDLDLRLIDPSSQQHYPWTLDPFSPGSPAVRTQADHVNNIEQVLVDNPATGVWRVEVSGYDVPQGPQVFSLCGSPELIACSSQGTIGLDASRYPCSAAAGIGVVDCDLNTDNNTVESVTVTISSDSEPGGESVLLTETGAETADFRGTILLDVTDSAGVLLIAHGDTVTATYIDADDGQGGQNVPVTALATVDCTPPVISNVETTNIQAHSATVTFDTDEPASGTARYGSSCGALTESATEAGLNTAHAVNLTGLQENSTYFYAVDAVDEAGNASSDDNSGACHTFATPDIPDYFTEQFTGDNDLDNLSLTFTPDGSSDYYAGCAEPIGALPVDPSDGTTLTLTDDAYATINLTGGDTVSLYGTGYATFYICSNGFVTFTAGDNDYTESLADHFDLPRISALFDDFNPLSGGTISWKQLADRAVVTWENLPEYGTTNLNTFQVE